MKRILFLAFLFAAYASIVAIPTEAARSEQPAKSGGIRIEHPWARATPPSAPSGAAYMIVRNGGSQTDRLIAVRSAAAAHVEIHASTRDGNIVRMTSVPGGVAIPAGGKVAFEPTGLHLMLAGLKHPLVQGQTLPLTLTFERAGDIEVDAAIDSVGASGPAAGMGGDMDMGMHH